jgi:DNA-binding MarR family transcriptional regulator
MRDASFFDEYGEPLSKRVAVGLQKLGLALKTQAWQGAEERGLTPTQGQILALLKNRGELRLGDVAESIGVKASTASESVRVLVEKGLIQKQRATDDARAVALGLTEKGQQEAAKAASWPDFLLGAINTLSQDEKEGFWVGLVKVMQTLQHQEQLPTARMCVSCEHFRPNSQKGSSTPHYCAALLASFATSQIRLDCKMHQSIPKEGPPKNWAEAPDVSKTS